MAIKVFKYLLFMVAGFVLAVLLCRKKNKARAKQELEPAPMIIQPDWENSLYD